MFAQNPAQGVNEGNGDITTVDPQSITDQEQERETISGEPVVQSLSFASE